MLWKISQTLDHINISFIILIYNYYYFLKDHKYFHYPTHHALIQFFFQLSFWNPLKFLLSLTLFLFHPTKIVWRQFTFETCSRPHVLQVGKRGAQTCWNADNLPLPSSNGSPYIRANWWAESLWQGRGGLL